MQGIYGAGAHTDYGVLTVLATDSSPGLQIHTQGKWQSVKPVPGTFVINLGDMLERCPAAFVFCQCISTEFAVVVTLNELSMLSWTQTCSPLLDWSAARNGLQQNGPAYSTGEPCIPDRVALHTVQHSIACSLLPTVYHLLYCQQN